MSRLFSFAPTAAHLREVNMPLPSLNLELIHKYTDAALDLVKKANAIGASVELALQALHDRFFAKHEPDVMRAGDAYEQCPPELQAAIDEAVAGT